MEIQFSPFFALPILILYLIIALLTPWGKRHSIERHFLHMAFILYLMAVIALTFFPIPLDRSGSSYNISRNSWIPFQSTWILLRYAKPMVAFTQIIGNLSLFLPFGLMLPLLHPKWNRLLRIFLLSFGVAFSIELLQFAVTLFAQTNYRSFDVDDIGMNVIGALIGALLYRGIRKRVI
ncbi:VanZ family protein [Marininema halotolerans]|uniref:Glycopeptide antibiotics resistance protein n=1 Tax=Marininema halotolerans TaxID=1155944 RepID=A0A1I6QNE2_9BACL|nr:VanZ family protein [Marininema halotolerans]SFS53959.1 Glycopeptide antibiotics resistance protein [Marininema halotolerans]